MHGVLGARRLLETLGGHNYMKRQIALSCRWLVASLVIAPIGWGLAGGLIAMVHAQSIKGVAWTPSGDALRPVAAWVFGAGLLVAFIPLLLVAAIVIYDAVIARKNEHN